MHSFPPSALPVKQCIIPPTPSPFRGKRNEPGYVKLVAEQIAELKGMTYEEVAAITSENAKKLFGIS